MRRVNSAAWAAILMGAGYLMGAGQLSLPAVTAQDAADPTAMKIHNVHRSLLDAKDALETDGKYTAITDGLNAFLILSGGGNAKEDLESGRGVDPDTFAALYAGRATPEIAPLLGVNEQGQITYNNEVIRMYSKSRLQKAFADRLKFVELEM
ncbi:hypothetical protein [Planctomicrobium piriforme]|uniref:Uncharacterized protein n=1 Tax=Planctomicrobium piriforme TaxID=1576369 RepID=A0A1I3PDZ0_9PLAN|nr:hypothetical protein [Planctomicrobium piriforme]SFJ19540.1 hypothetical protein SAMN05421753_116117 [Planctomicrobium piriforme]